MGTRDGQPIWKRTSICSMDKRLQMMAPPALGTTCPPSPPLHPQLRDKFWKSPGGRVAPSGTPVAAASSMNGCGCLGPASEGIPCEKLFEGKNAYPLQGEALQGFEALPTFLGQEARIPLCPHPTAPLLIFLEQTNKPPYSPSLKQPLESGLGPSALFIDVYCREGRKLNAQDRAGASQGQGEAGPSVPLGSGASARRTWMRPQRRFIWLPPPEVSPEPYPGRVLSLAEPRGQKMAGSGQGDPRRRWPELPPQGQAGEPSPIIHGTSIHLKSKNRVPHSRGVQAASSWAQDLIWSPGPPLATRSPSWPSL